MRRIAQRTKVNFYEIPSLKSILKYYINDSLIIFDIDNTLIKPVNEAALGSDQWFNALLTHSLKLIDNPFEAKQLAITIRNAVYRMIEMEMVEPIIQNIMKELQYKNIPYIALTARGKTIMTETKHQLRQLNIVFTQAERKENQLEDQLLQFQEGVIYCAGTDKGLALTHYLNEFEFPKNIIMIDDSKQNLLSVSSALQYKNTNFIGLHYSFLHHYISQFNMQRATLELSKLKHIMTEHEQSAINRLGLSASNGNRGLFF